MTRPATTLAGIGFAVIFGGSFLVTKQALAALDPFEVLFLRFLIATAIVATLGLIRVVRLDFREKPLGRLGLVCLLQPLLYFPCEIYGLREAQEPPEPGVRAQPTRPGVLHHEGGIQQDP